MYLSFFGLSEKPFAITPDPRYLYLSERHAEALAHLLYGINESGGFIQLTGEVGTGKTTVVRTLLSRVPHHADVAVIERCSGHGGSWGVRKENFATAIKVGKPVARQTLKNATRFVSSECPLAGMHIVQGMEIEAGSATPPQRQLHPIELVARAYGIPGDWLDDGARSR